MTKSKALKILNEYYQKNGNITLYYLFVKQWRNDMNYEEKLRLAKEALESGSYDKKTIEYVFPELAESENDRIKKALIKCMERFPYDRLEINGISVEDAITWLEKQGEQKSAWSEHQHKLLNYAISMTDDTEVKCFLESLRNTDSNASAKGSKEDEYQLNTILYGIYLKREIYKKEGNKVEEDRYNTQYNWLKSFKSNH